MEVLTRPAAVVEAEAFFAAVHLADPDESDAAVVRDTLAAAAELIGSAANRPLGEHRVIFSVPARSGTWWFPCAPVLGINEVTIQRADGAWVPFANWRLLDDFSEPRLRIGATGQRADALLQVNARVGYDDGTVPPSLKQAVILLAKDWYEAGIAVEARDETALAFGVKALIRKHRYLRPREWA
ncbi:head-tail connector protein [Pseudoroseicyclus aestuarii]|uniref:Putative phiE125 gp8 family phage protein n=1 Tax=Pseudoroseicyclus aestuarii TaxID=1795041 RepID=A0A318SRS4_9RHOB|nr:head-tail connector protein [Pseudoroseicyclus aestuarii]PYE80819.1 putative phiE125 gp8 family phage protein [Pseudoroseicyclus aestuarii]